MIDVMKSLRQKISIFWFRRDLRLEDNHALSKALEGDNPVLPLFIFDTNILEKLPRNDHRVTFIYQSLCEVNGKLKEKYNSQLAIYQGKPTEVFMELLKHYDISDVYANHDYEPYAKKRDNKVEKYLSASDIEFLTFKDQVIFEKSEVTKGDGSPYVVYTPYMKRWRTLLKPSVYTKVYNTDIHNFLQSAQLPWFTLSDIGFTSSQISMPHTNLSKNIIDNYKSRRDFPAVNGTSHLGTALRFGTLSIRQVVTKALVSSDQTFLNELIWREFFMQVMWHFPYSATRAFREKYDAVPWRNDPEDLQKWKDGQTGYPLVDAGMRELNATGYMHNRVRMVVASFLCKHLLIDWREGERYFAEKLFDYELSSNVGNWQWAAGSGVDAAPYFRVFNPETQMKKFDPDGVYVRRWVPEYFELGYISPIVNHKEARERAIETYKNALKSV